MPSKQDELVLCVRDADIAGNMEEIAEIDNVGHDGWWAKYNLLLICSVDPWFITRRIAETDDTWRQIIPYTIVTSGDRVLTYCRAKTGGEDRLHDLWSVGFGGHINLADVPVFGVGKYGEIDVQATVVMSRERELREELSGVNWTKGHEGRFQHLGVIRIKEPVRNTVNNVHLGLVSVIQLVTDPTEVRPNKLEASQYRWVVPGELKDLNLEPWSRLVVDYATLI